MEDIETVVYYYDELNESAKEKAREWYTEDLDYPYFREYLKTIESFCAEFNVKIKEYSIGAYAYSYIDTDANNSHFRGLKLKDYLPKLGKDYDFIEYVLWVTFINTWKESSDPLKAFNEAITLSVRDIQKDWEYMYSCESVEENIFINGYTFTEDGRRF